MKIEELASLISLDLLKSLKNFVLKNWKYEKGLFDKFIDDIRTNCLKLSYKILGSHDKNKTLRDAGFESE